MNTTLLTTLENNFLKEQGAFYRFRRALLRPDQLVFDDLFASAGKHLAAAQLVDHATPIETMLLCMLLEERKEIKRLQAHVDEAMAGNP